MCRKRNRRKIKNRNAISNNKFRILDKTKRALELIFVESVEAKYEQEKFVTVLLVMKMKERQSSRKIFALWKSWIDTLF